MATRSRTSEVPMADLCGDLKLMEEDTARWEGKNQELDAQLQAIDEEIYQETEKQQNLEQEKETLFGDQQTLNGQLAALLTERDRMHAKERECFLRMQASEKKHVELVATGRAARKGYAAEALRLLDSGQDITRHFVIDLDGELEEVSADVASLKEQVRELCEKSSREKEKSQPDVEIMKCTNASAVSFSVFMHRCIVLLFIAGTHPSFVTSIWRST
ncbi:hypothetical protein BV898_09387 [Hypsibius exemplaris]|uniref:Uncharacterized protein n=1 Tax=Hypsibius exemplaris TaxID=2072580 RepID=A0A1W0WMZ6_HYPEX|nr:hypothetical protein BV898_09387 [Hypsibius exemplaris]